MAKIVLYALWSVVCVGVCYGASPLPTKDPSEPMCGDWTPFKNEKCLKIADRAGPQTQEDAEVICRTYADGTNIQSIPKLVTVKSKEEQEFLQRFLFVENDLVDHVWLGLRKNRNSGSFEWNDGGSEVAFNNWASQTISDDEHECVEMESGEGAADIGLWLRVNCRRKNAVVCEYRPTWSVDALQNALLNFKKEQDGRYKLREQKQQEWEKRQEEIEQKQKELNEKAVKSDAEISTMTQELDTLSNPVPLGFVYVQLSGQEPPTILWPAAKWMEVTNNYSGLFFRAAGEKAAPFDEIQQESCPRLKQIEYKFNVPVADQIYVPTDGTWSAYINTGYIGGEEVFFRFQLSTDEVRPRNQAVKIWQRIN